jgi:hypothetical protein
MKRGTIQKGARNSSVTMSLVLGSAPASGAVSRASRLTFAGEVNPRLVPSHAAFVRRETRRTAAGRPPSLKLDYIVTD